MKKILWLIPIFLLFILPLNTFAEEIKTDVTTNQKYNYCLYDVKAKDHMNLMDNYIKKHTNNVELQHYYNTEHLLIDIDENSPLLDCKVLNISFMTTFSYFYPEPVDYKMVSNLFEYQDTNNYVVTSAGNYKEMERQNIFHKKRNENIFIVGQAELVDEDTIIHHFAIGENIDFVIPNYDETKGTSAAAGLFSSILIEALENDIPDEKIRDLFVFSGFYELDKVNYRVLDVEKTRENIKRFVNNEPLIETEYHEYLHASYKEPITFGIIFFILLSSFIVTIVCTLLYLFIKFKIKQEI